jgi:hypothetical protein
MKKVTLQMTSKLTSLVLLLSLTGCVTTPDGHNVPDVKLMCSVAQTAAYTGSSIYLLSHPQDRPKFELARNSLQALIAAGTFSAEDLTRALQSLPIKQLEGEKGILIVGTAVSLWDAYGQQLVELDKAQVFETYILPVAIAIKAGLDSALAIPSTP